MRQATWGDPSGVESRPEGAASSIQAHELGGVQQISLLDAAGDTREGFVLRMPRWDASAPANLQALKGDFRIVILGEPPETSIQAPPGTVICAPVAPAKAPAAVREPTTVYAVEAERPPTSLTAAEATLLSLGKLLAPVDLRVTPQEVFGAGEPRFELLARDILTSEALADYLGPLAVALAAPAVPGRSPAQELMAALQRLVHHAEAPLPGLEREVGPEATGAIDRLSQLSAAAGVESFLACARRLYPRVPAFLEDVYLLRALAERLSEALEMLSMRAFLVQAVVPPTDPDLLLDRAVVLEQLQFASLIPEPQRLNTARAALDYFRSHYQRCYAAHHRSCWTETARLHARLLEAKDHAEALRRLNTLTELGPPVGEASLETYRELVEQTSGCSLLGAEGEKVDEALCPACRLRLDQQPPQEQVSEVLKRVERAIERQMARLSAVAVRQVLERSTNPHVEQFLKVIQAAQIASLAEILDDELMGYLRRFLVEARIGSVLDPILSHLEQGTPPKAEEAQAALRELAQVLQRAFRASGRALPPPRAALKEGPAKKPRA